MKAKAYYAVQDSHEMGMGQKFVKTSPVLHEFKSEKARDAWVERATDRRRKVNAKEKEALQAQSPLRTTSPVRHATLPKKSGTRKPNASSPQVDNTPTMHPKAL